jgi:hypothetical protein
MGHTIFQHAPGTSYLREFYTQQLSCWKLNITWNRWKPPNQCLQKELHSLFRSKLQGMTPQGVLKHHTHTTVVVEWSYSEVQCSSTQMVDYLHFIYMFICSLFYDVLPETMTTTRMINRKGFGRKSSWPSFKVLSRIFPGGTAKCHKNFSQNSRSPSLDLNQGPPKHETRLSTAWPRRSVRVILW